MASPKGSTESETPYDPLDLTSLDADSIFSALSAIERAVPTLLENVKPILRHLTTGSGPSTAINGGITTSTIETEEEIGQAAREGIENYLNTLDKIQYILRQTVYYLRETKASPSALRPPPPNAIPTPFASSLPSHALDATEGSAGDEKAELGLYASRLESRTLGDMLDSLRSLQRQMERRRRDENGIEDEGKADERENNVMSIDPRQTDILPG